MDEPLLSADTNYKGSFYFFLRDNKKLLIQILGTFLLFLLLAPFYKTFVVALIFYAGAVATRRMVKQLPLTKKWIFRVIFYGVIIAFLGLFYWFFRKVSQSSVVFSKAGTRSAVLEKFENLFNANIETIEKWIVGVFPGIEKTDIHKQFVEGLQTILESSFNWMFSFFSDLPMFLLQFSFFITAVIWLAHSRGKEFDYFDNFIFKNVSRRQARKFWTIVEESSYQTLICTFLVSLVQASILGLTAIALDISVWPFIFLIAFIFSFFPVVGTLPAAALGIILAYTQDGINSAVIFAVAALVTSVTDNFLRTWLISTQESVTPSSFNFFAIIGGIALFGFSGVLIGPFILAFATILLKKNIA